MESHDEIRKYCACTYFACPLGCRLPSVLLCKKQSQPDGVEQRSRVACLCHPHNPEICPVLALPFYIFANPGIFTDKSEEQEDGVEVELQGGDGAGRPCSHKGCLFPGGNKYEEFMDCLHCIIEKYPDELFALGILPGNLGSHLARKGASSHACSGTTVLLPMVSICLCAMWSMGHVKERYLQFKKAGDQYLGRVVCGLNVNSVKFTVLPPFLILMIPSWKTEHHQLSIPS